MQSRMNTRQLGAITIIVMMLLVAGVLLILSQSADLLRNRGTDTSQELDSSAALMLAESGLARARAIITSGQTSGTFGSTTCDGIATGGPFSLGRGTFNYTSVVADPAGCAAGACNTCTVTAAGTVGGTQRTLSTVFSLGTLNGVTGRGQTVRMVLKNTYTVPALALFDLSWRRQGQGGNSASTLTTCLTCTLLWNIESSNGKPSVGGMGTAVPIDANVLSQLVTQTLSLSRDFVEVGGLFPSVNSSSPVLKGSYWSNNGTSQTKANNQTWSGATNSGVVESDTSTCLVGSTVPNPPGNNTNQTCNNWCKDGDTLVFGFSGRSSTITGEIQDTSTTAVKFGTGGSNPQNVQLTRLVHFPNTDGSIGGATGQIYSEIWYAANPAYKMTGSFGTGAGASSYPRNVVAGAGGQITLSANGGNNDVSLTAASVSGYVCVGDSFVSGTNLNTSTITAVPGGGTCSNSSGTYGFSPKATGNVNKNNTFPQVASTRLIVQRDSYGPLKTGGDLQAGTTDAGAVTIAAGGAGSITIGGNTYVTYPLSSAAYQAVTNISQGSASNTIYLPGSAPLPAVGTKLQVYSTGTGGSGVLAAQVAVTAQGTNSFTVSGTTPSIKNVVLCGGTCAFFNDPSSTSSSTSFTFTPVASTTTQWAGGFMCMSGVDASKIVPVVSSAVRQRTWSESIQ
jgi:hypothetical protein